MVLLTFIVLIRMFRSRVADVKSGATNATYYKTYNEGAETRHSAQLSRHFVNLFEAPVLFYAACVVAMLTGLHAALMISLAWVYVALRVLHTFIHLGQNKIQPRLYAYFSSWIILLAMWGTLVVGVASSQ